MILLNSENFFQFYKNNTYDILKEENGIKYWNIFICNNKRDNLIKILEDKKIKMVFYDKYINLKY